MFGAFGVQQVAAEAMLCMLSAVFGFTRVLKLSALLTRNQGDTAIYDKFKQ
jgi:hypothetical protein